MGSTRKILLLSSPWRTPQDSDVGMSTLRSLLLEAGIAADMLHGTLLFPPAEGNEYVRLQYSGLFFVPYLHPEVSREACADLVLRTYLHDYNLGGIRVPSESVSFEALGLDGEAIGRGVRGDVDRAGLCIERCVRHALDDAYDVVGLSCTFEAQLPAALAIAERLRALRPGVRLVLGGAACFGEPAREIMRWSRALDAVCYTEGDQTIVPLVRAARGELPMETVPGIVWRDAGGAMHRTPPPPLLTDLDSLPTPDYGPFLAQLARSEWRSVPARLFFETSRGCWWGQKHQCTFCGLNGHGVAYRKKSSERAYREIRALYERYPEAAILQATDNILDMDHLREVMPRLRDLPRRLGHPLRLFYETKSNLSRDQVRTLAEAGVTYVQPGIESLSDDILALMNKGTTGLRQVQLLRWMVEDGILPIYNMLVLNPAENAAAYRSMRRLLPYVDHLPAPYVFAIWLERHSPYYERPADYGVSRIRARAYYRFMCRSPDVDLERLAFVFDYDHANASDEELRAEIRAFTLGVDAWRERVRPGLLAYLEGEDHVTVVDRRDGSSRVERLAGLGAELFRYLDRVRREGDVRRRFPDVSPALLCGLLDRLRARRWVCRDDRGRLLCVVPRAPAARKA